MIMAHVSIGMPHRRAAAFGSRCWAVIFYAALLAGAALIAVEAAPAKAPPKSKPPPKPVASKPPPKPIVSKPPPKPIVSKPPPKPIASKPPPKQPKLRSPRPSVPNWPVIADPFFCRPCVTIYGNVGYTGQSATFSNATCLQVADVIIANLTSTLRAAKVEGFDLLSADCSSGAQISVCGFYYFWQREFVPDAGNVLAQGWLSYLTSSGFLKGSCGSEPAGTALSLSATLTDSRGPYSCMTGSANASWFCSS